MLRRWPLVFLVGLSILATTIADDYDFGDLDDQFGPSRDEDDGREKRGELLEEEPIPDVTPTPIEEPVRREEPTELPPLIAEPCDAQAGSCVRNDGCTHGQVLDASGCKEEEVCCATKTFSVRGTDNETVDKPEDEQKVERRDYDGPQYNDPTYYTGGPYGNGYHGYSAYDGNYSGPPNADGALTYGTQYLGQRDDLEKLLGTKDLYVKPYTTPGLYNEYLNADDLALLTERKSFVIFQAIRYLKFKIKDKQSLGYVVKDLDGNYHKKYDEGGASYPAYPGGRSFTASDVPYGEGGNYSARNYGGTAEYAKGYSAVGNYGGAGYPSSYTCHPGKYRTYDGYCNNPHYPNWGRAFTILHRLLPPAYADGVSAPRSGKDGYLLPNPRLISSYLVHDHSRPIYYNSLTVMQWGQFIVHDISFTPVYKARGTHGILCCAREIYHNPKLLHPECFPILVPKNDYFYARQHGYTGCMEFIRSLAGPSYTGKREQQNQASAYIDGSLIYGSTEEHARSLRSFKYGMLTTVKKHGYDYIPISRHECSYDPSECYRVKTGDSRANMHPWLTVLHHVYVRFHNYIAHHLYKVNPGWDDEYLYQESRKIVGASLQYITYNEYLPVLLGYDYVKRYGLGLKHHGHSYDYDHKLNAGVLNEFVTAAFRSGHSTIYGTVFWRSREYGNGELGHLRHHYFQPYVTSEPGIMDKYILSLMTQWQESVDTYVTKEVTNYLFKTKNSSYGFDLVSLNIQRGRDHGLPAYNEYRKLCGLNKAYSFEDLYPSINKEVIEKLKYLYKTVDDIDLYIGGIAENPYRYSLLGPTFSCIIASQYHRLKRGDYYWHELGNLPWSFTLDQLTEIRKIRLGTLFCHFADKIKYSPRWVFKSPGPKNPYFRCNDERAFERIDFYKWKHGSYSNGSYGNYGHKDYNPYGGAKDGNYGTPGYGAHSHHSHYGGAGHYGYGGHSYPGHGPYGGGSGNYSGGSHHREYAKGRSFGGYIKQAIYNATRPYKANGSHDGYNKFDYNASGGYGSYPNDGYGGGDYTASHSYGSQPENYSYYKEYKNGSPGSSYDGYSGNGGYPSDYVNDGSYSGGYPGNGGYDGGYPGNGGYHGGYPGNGGYHGGYPGNGGYDGGYPGNGGYDGGYPGNGGYQGGYPGNGGYQGGYPGNGGYQGGYPGNGGYHGGYPGNGGYQGGYPGNGGYQGGYPGNGGYQGGYPGNGGYPGGHHGMGGYPGGHHGMGGYPGGHHGMGGYPGGHHGMGGYPGGYSGNGGYPGEYSGNTSYESGYHGDGYNGNGEGHAYERYPRGYNDSGGRPMSSPYIQATFQGKPAYGPPGGNGGYGSGKNYSTSSKLGNYKAYGSGSHYATGKSYGYGAQGRAFTAQDYGSPPAYDSYSSAPAYGGGGYGGAPAYGAGGYGGAPSYGSGDYYSGAPSYGGHDQGYGTDMYGGKDHASYDASQYGSGYGSSGYGEGYGLSDYGSTYGGSAHDRGGAYGGKAHDYGKSDSGASYDASHGYGGKGYDAGDRYAGKAYDHANRYDAAAYGSGQAYNDTAYDAAAKYADRQYGKGYATNDSDYSGAGQYGKKAYATADASDYYSHGAKDRYHDTAYGKADSLKTGARDYGAQYGGQAYDTGKAYGSSAYDAGSKYDAASKAKADAYDAGAAQKYGSAYGQAGAVGDKYYDAHSDSGAKAHGVVAYSDTGFSTTAYGSDASYGSSSYGTNKTYGGGGAAHNKSYSSDYDAKSYDTGKAYGKDRYNASALYGAGYSDTAKYHGGARYDADAYAKAGSHDYGKAQHGADYDSAAKYAGTAYDTSRDYDKAHAAYGSQTDADRYADTKAYGAAKYDAALKEGAQYYDRGKAHGQAGYDYSKKADADAYDRGRGYGAAQYGYGAKAAGAGYGTGREYDASRYGAGHDYYGAGEAKGQQYAGDLYDSSKAYGGDYHDKGSDYDASGYGKKQDYNRTGYGGYGHGYGAADKGQRYGDYYGASDKGYMAQGGPGYYSDAPYADDASLATADAPPTERPKGRSYKKYTVSSTEYYVKKEIYPTEAPGTDGQESPHERAFSVLGAAEDAYKSKKDYAKAKYDSGTGQAAHQFVNKTKYEESMSSKSKKFESEVYSSQNDTTVHASGDKGSMFEGLAKATSALEKQTQDLAEETEAGAAEAYPDGNTRRPPAPPTRGQGVRPQLPPPTHGHHPPQYRPV